MADYSTFKQESIENQPRFFKTRLREFEVNSPNAVNVQGKRFPLSDQGLDSIRSFVKMPRAFSERMSRNLGDDATISLMDALRRGKTNMDSDKQIFIVFDSEDGSVKAIKGHYPRLTRKGYFDLVERVIDEYNLDIVGCSEEDDMLRVKTENSQNRVRMADTENEVFRAGPTFVSDLGNLEIHSFMVRLVCTNGMIARREDQDFQAKLNREDMTEFFEYLNELEENNFIPEGFRRNMDSAMDHAASFDELESVRDVMKHAGDDEPYVPDHIVNKHVPYEENFKAYLDLGVNPEDMTRRKKRNAPTNITVWELVNNLTSFATHDPADIGLDESQSDNMIEKAGEMLSKKFDTQDLPPQPNFHLN